jgi:hypothetical protein
LTIFVLFELQRFGAARRFQRDGGVSGLLATTRSAGLGLNLCAAAAVVFLEHSHLDAAQREAAVSLLVGHRYRVATLPSDILAVCGDLDSLV